MELPLAHRRIYMVYSYDTMLLRTYRSEVTREETSALSAKPRRQKATCEMKGDQEPDAAQPNSISSPRHIAARLSITSTTNRRPLLTTCVWCPANTRHQKSLQKRVCEAHHDRCRFGCGRSDDERPCLCAHTWDDPSDQDPSRAFRRRVDLKESKIAW